MATRIQPVPTPIEHVFDPTVTYKPKDVEPYDKGSTLSTQPQTAQEVWEQQKAHMYSGEPRQWKQEKLHAEKVLSKVKYAQDGRERILTTTKWPYSFNAQLSIEMDGKTYIGSGALVGPHHLLTCAHNVYNDQKKRWAQEINCYPALNDSYAPFGEAKAVKVYTFTDWTDRGDKHYDIALLILNHSIGKFTGWGGLLCTSDAELTQEKVNIVGYPGDKGMRQMWGMEHTLDKISPEEFEYSIDTCPGQSGSAIWIDKFGNPMILGVHTLGGDSANYGVRISEQKFSKIVEKISETFILAPAATVPFANAVSQNPGVQMQIPRMVPLVTTSASQPAADAPNTQVLAQMPEPFVKKAMHAHYNSDTEPYFSLMTRLKQWNDEILKLTKPVPLSASSSPQIIVSSEETPTITALSQRAQQKNHPAKVAEISQRIAARILERRLSHVTSAPSLNMKESLYFSTTPSLTFKGHSEEVKCLIELEDGTLASCSNDKTIKFWNHKGECIQTLQGHQSVVSIIELKDGTLASGFFDATIKLWNRKGEYIQTLQGEIGTVRPIIELKDGILASCGSWNSVIDLWNRKGERIQTLQGHTGTVRSLIEFKDGTLASGSDDKTIKFWNRKGECIQTLQGHTHWVSSLTELKDGTLASGSWDTTIKLWNRKGECIQTLEAMTGGIICSLIELKDGTLASSCGDGTIKLWNRKGGCVQTLQGHIKLTYSLVELKDGNLASCSEDKTIMLWDRIAYRGPQS